VELLNIGDMIMITLFLQAGQGRKEIRNKMLLFTMMHADKCMMMD
jgi:hypothetical protein